MFPSDARTSQASTSGGDEDDASLHVSLDGNSTKIGQASDGIAENADLKNETKKTSVVRCLVITTLLTSAAIVANVALIMALNEEEVQFKKEYTRLSNRLIDRFLDAFGEKISAADSLATQYSVGNMSQPHLFSIPMFEMQAEAIRQLSTSMTLSYSPFLKDSVERAEFEASVVYTYNESARSSFESEYLPHDSKYNFDTQPLVSYVDTSDRAVQDGIFQVVDGVPVPQKDTSFYAPIWQVAPFNDATKSTIMFNQMSEEKRSVALDTLLQNHGYIISDIFFEKTMGSVQGEYKAPVIEIYYPLSRDIVSAQQDIVGALTFSLGLEALLEGALHGFEDAPMTAVVQTSCGGEMSFIVTGERVEFLGTGDLHENIPDVGTMDIIQSSYEQFDEIVKSLSDIYPTSDEVLCSYRVITYPTVESHDLFLTNRPIVIQAIVGLIFLFTVAVFLGYDCLVERRQRRVLAAAQRTNALVGSLFPQAVRDRLYVQSITKKGMKFEAAPKLRLKNFMANDITNEKSDPSSGGNGTEPIADLFPNCTVLFADVSGFSAWASERQPSEVFTLLETLFTSFDTIARKLGVFKVETVGDCYVAAAGIPDARDDHATTMVRFANAMLLRANDLCKALEATLGPGTGDLTIRAGVHSGAITAGVLRGEKSRFQLFGDTMNSASRMESTSVRGKIQLSSDTADLLIECGKAHWIEPREDLIDVKGKGTMQTYWVRPGNKEGAGAINLEENAVENSIHRDQEAKERLIDWNLTAMIPLLERIVAGRGKMRRGSKSDRMDTNLRPDTWNVKDEVQEVIQLAHFDSQAVIRSENGAVISAVVRSELRDYIAQISSLYLNNPFHNFSHASHVTMSCHKLFKRINRPEEVDYTNTDKESVVKELHEATYGISSDPLTQLAIIFAALIHDAGHTGVPNGQLASESPILVSKYGNQSLAEQHSLDIGLELLEAPCYSNLRACILPTSEEQERFRQLIINTVLATDIFDEHCSAIRKARWAKAFGRDPNEAEDEHALDRKATIVLEHVIQASDVAHTMQHWKIYTKWNMNLYEEMYKAYYEGRSNKDPTEGWYKGELWFFDNYIIPLAKKLKECGVFGTSSDEYLHYAVENRMEWEQKGQAIVEMMEKRMMESMNNDEEEDEFLHSSPPSISALDRSDRSTRY